MFRIPAAVLVLLISATQGVLAADVNYLRDVKPILQQRCFACHAALKQESSLRLDTAAALRRGGDSGSAIEPGKSAASLLVERITASDEDERMPPEGNPLTAEQIGLITLWIDQGAIAPADERPEQDPRQHWAFQPPQRPEIPTVENERWRGNPIDALIAAQHQRLGLVPVGPVEKPLLLRRVYLDLIGLPPTRAQLQAFLADTRADAYEQVVDRLLRSPHYGERWGRHWMDIWRYTDWFGLGAQLRYSQKHIWHWRDWIIESLNDDKGYDRMIVEMLAADEVAPTDRDVLRATGFLARNYFLFNRTTWLDNTIEHTSKAFLGLTMNCAKCHDHKYDPITQLDYYRFRAVFEPHQVRLDALPGQTDLERDGLPRAFDAHPDAPTYLHIRGDAMNPDTSRVIQPAPPAVLTTDAFQVAAVELPPEAHNPALQQFVLKDHLRAAEMEIAVARKALDKAQQQLAAAQQAAQTAVAATTEPPPGPEPDSAAPSAPGPLFLTDDFSKAEPQLWETGPGKWTYQDGRLIQTQTGAARAYLRTRREHPADFQATLKFKTTGGDMWKSVGLAFDVADGREKLVYMSAVAPGSKLQISYNNGGGHAYPTDGKIDRPVTLNQSYELTITARGPLVNVAINGQHALAYQLPTQREAGRIDLVAFDAVAEFDALQIRALPPHAKLVQAGQGVPQPAGPPSVEQAMAAHQLAEKLLAAAELRPVALRTAHAAEIARHQPTPPEYLQQLVHAAAAAARRHEYATAEAAVARAEQKLVSNDAKQQSSGEKELASARDRLAKAQAALENPGDQYSSVTASLKALEGPDESDASRRQPYPTTSTGRRTALARWITNPNNPLTARVAVNHIWSRHFGQPLVESVTDFGLRSKRPPQHALLDWLAVELMHPPHSPLQKGGTKKESALEKGGTKKEAPLGQRGTKNESTSGQAGTQMGWSMKHLHRLIVTSQTYRLGTSAAGADAATQRADPNNDYYWRRTPLRMESQIIRDSLLQLAGVLDARLGGPTIDPKKDDTLFRRSIYFTHSRDDQHPFLTMFDDADILRCYRRTESIIPQQALALANSKLALSMARKIAGQLPADGEPPDDKSFVERVFETVLCRRPDRDETEACIEAMQELRNQGQSDARTRENLVHAILNHNDFVTIR